MAQKQPEPDDEGPRRGTGEGKRSSSPLDQLGVLAMQAVPIDDELDHLEIYTMEGLLTVLWHGPAELDRVAICVGGAMGGLLGPDGGLFHQLGRALPERGVGVLRVSYRRPNDLSSCVHDVLAVMELAARHGAERFVTLGHSFGGAVAIQAAAHLDAASVPGVVTFATQSAGCEPAELLADRNLLFFHGTADQILPFHASEMVRMLAGAGELVLLDGADHLLKPAGPEIFGRLLEHLPAVLADPSP
ncbi:MAG: alpha/beta hydrolase [Acidimicrobiales bacterium]